MKKKGQSLSPALRRGGGFTGKEALLTVSGEFDESDLPSFTFSTVNALRDDGEATSVPVKLSLIEAQLGVDTAPPEPFSPLISSSPDIFEGTSFLSFFAQDKDTGIEGYEYAVTWLLPPNNNKDWQKAESPLLLSRPMLFQKIYIRALDHAGNDRTVSTPGPYRYYLTIFGVIMLLCVLLLLRRSFHSRSSLPY